MKTGNRRRRLLRRKQKARELRARCARWQAWDALEQEYWEAVYWEELEAEIKQEERMFNAMMQAPDPIEDEWVVSGLDYDWID